MREIRNESVPTSKEQREKTAAWEKYKEGVHRALKSPIKEKAIEMKDKNRPRGLHEPLKLEYSDLEQG